MGVEHKTLRLETNVGHKTSESSCLVENPPQILILVLLKGIEVFADGTTKQDGILRNDGHSISQRVHRNAANVNPIHNYAAAVKLKHTEQRQSQRGFTRPCAANDTCTHNATFTACNLRYSLGVISTAIKPIFSAACTANDTRSNAKRKWGRYRSATFSKHTVPFAGHEAETGALSDDSALAVAVACQRIGS
jgi:hypothetical protein